LFVTLGRYLLIAMEWVNDNMIHSYAIAIIVFTGVLKLLAMPADIKQRRSMARTQSLQPEVEQIQKRYSGNPDIAQKKVQELYKKNNASMTAGCLPMMLTMLIFMVFLRAMTFWSYLGTIDLYKNAREQEVAALQSGQEFVIEKDGANDFIHKNYKVLWVNNIWSPDSFRSQVIMPYSQFAQTDFSQLDLFYTADELREIKAITAADYNRTMKPYVDAYGENKNGWGFLPVLAALSMLIISLVQQKLNPQPKPAAGAGGNPAAGMSTPMMVMMAAMSGWICFTSNAGFAIYWLVSNVFGFFITISIHLPGFLEKRKKAAANGIAVTEDQDARRLTNDIKSKAKKKKKR